MRNRFFSFLLALALLGSISSQHDQLIGQAATGIGRGTPVWVTLNATTLGAAGNVIGPLAVRPMKRLRITLYVSGYGGAGETAAYQFNGDTGTNYRTECSTSTDGITYAPGTNNGTSVDRIRIAPANTNNMRNVESIVVNDPAKAEHTVTLTSLTGTGSAASQATFDNCNGGWVSSTAQSITSVKVITSTANMGKGSSVIIEGSNF